ncbi:MAG: sigma-54-dependent Fis family transcriptional regulator [Nitrospinae bacterium]|nr:sigma-54-dependent Fis family transcriptional regulator [Nitrospinota bacterium]
MFALDSARSGNQNKIVANILLVDDDAGFTEPVSEYLARRGCRVTTAATVQEGADALAAADIDAVILDINLAGESGLKLLEYMTEKKPGVPVAILTGEASLDTSIRALRLRAVDYLMKPLPLDELFLRIEGMTGKIIGGVGAPMAEAGGIIGDSPKIKDVLRQIHHVGKTAHNVLVTGESGTGKELAARAIHDNSGRAKGPFVTVNCAALGDTLFHGEMFGYKKGSYTGAVASHSGYLKTADGGSLLLDEIGEIPVNSQVKLLRVLETGEYNPIGEPKPQSVNVRFIAATNRDIKKEVAAGNFRLDLFYRLNIFHIHLPSLRDRMEDVPMLADHFLKKHRNTSGGAKGFSHGAMEKMLAYSWPGNVRQLEGAVVRALAHCHGTQIAADDLPELADETESAGVAEINPAYKTKRITKIREAEMDCLVAALAEAKGNVTVAAESMGVNRATLYRKIIKYNINLDQYREI